MGGGEPTPSRPTGNLAMDFALKMQREQLICEAIRTRRYNKIVAKIKGKA